MMSRRGPPAAAPFRRSGLALALALVGALRGVSAAEAAAWNAEPLALPADLYRATPGSLDALVTPALQAPPGFSATADLVWGRRLLSYQLGTLPETVLLRDAVSVQIAAAWGMPRLDLGVSLPAYVHLGGDAFPQGGEGALGDLGVQARAALTPWLSVLAGATVPSGDPTRMTSYGQPTALLGGVLGGARLRTALGYLRTPSVNIGTEQADDRLQISARYGLQPRPRWWVGAEVWTALSYQDASRTSIPGELLLSSHHVLPNQGTLRLGLGTAILPGVGVPAARLVVGVGQAAAAPSGP